MYCALQDVLKLLLKNPLGHVEALLGRNEVAHVASVCVCVCERESGGGGGG
jgi:hypothetical protein